MSTETQSPTVDGRTGSWQAGAVGGVVGALVMGGLVLGMNPPTLAVAIPSLYGLAPPPTPGVGLFVHASHGAVLGVVFAGVADALDVRDPARLLGAGLAWGIVTWVGLAALLMPAWLRVVGSPASPPLPNFALPSLLWHAVYGVVLAGVFVAGRERLRAGVRSRRAPASGSSAVSGHRSGRFRPVVDQSPRRQRRSRGERRVVGAHQPDERLDLRELRTRRDDLRVVVPRDVSGVGQLRKVDVV
jgi:hypothetical protein